MKNAYCISGDYIRGIRNYFYHYQRKNSRSIKKEFLCDGDKIIKNRTIELDFPKEGFFLMDISTEKFEITEFLINPPVQPGGKYISVLVRYICNGLPGQFIRSEEIDIITKIIEFFRKYNQKKVNVRIFYQNYTIEEINIICKAFNHKLSEEQELLLNVLGDTNIEHYIRSDENELFKNLTV